MKLGSELSEADRKHVLAAFPYRFTAEKKPFWVRGTDCKSNPTWPQGRPGAA